MPSVHSENVEEATSLSALEAMASGRPLIAGDVGGLAEMVVDGETGLLVPADAEALAAAILRLAADPELGARMAGAAREYVVENHSHLRAAAAYAEVYRLTAAHAARIHVRREHEFGGAAVAEAAVPLAGAQPSARLQPPLAVDLGAGLSVWTWSRWSRRPAGPSSGGCAARDAQRVGRALPSPSIPSW